LFRVGGGEVGGFGRIALGFRELQSLMYGDKLPVEFMHLKWTVS
jgi:hypothetical protein